MKKLLIALLLTLAIQFSGTAYDAAEVDAAFTTLQETRAELEAALGTITEKDAEIDALVVVVADRDAEIVALEATAQAANDPLLSETWLTLTDSYMQLESDTRGEPVSWFYGLAQAVTRGVFEAVEAVENGSALDGTGNADLLLSFTGWRTGEYLALNAYVPAQLKPIGELILKYFPNPNPAG